MTQEISNELKTKFSKIAVKAQDICAVWRAYENSKLEKTDPSRYVSDDDDVSESDFIEAAKASSAEISALSAEISKTLAECE